MKMQSINPYTGETINEIQEYTNQQINDCILRSQTAFEDWKKTPFKSRKDLMLKLAASLNQNVENLAPMITNEMGKTLRESKAEIKKCAWVCEHYAEDAEILLQKEAVATDAYKALIHFEPLGTVLGIMPWNFPFWQVFRFLAPTLMAGNVVLLKHASNVQLCAQAIEELIVNAGFPSGVFQNLPVSAQKVETMVGNPVIKAVTLTGSEAAGMNVAGLAGQHLKKSVLELGGSNAFIVLEDADLDKAIEMGVHARMQNAGQSCIAAKRFILQKSIGERYIEGFKKRLSALNVGNPLDENTDLGPLASVSQAEKVHDQVQRSVEKGATMIFGESPDQALYYPAMLMNAHPGMPVFDEEVFGPVAAFMLVSTMEEAIKYSNQTKFGLGVSVFTNDLDKAAHIIPEFEEGSVFINSIVKSDPRLPFGGTKRSGYGRELAMNGIREFVNVKTVYIDKFHDTDDSAHENVVISTGRPA